MKRPSKKSTILRKKIVRIISSTMLILRIKLLWIFNRIKQINFQNFIEQNPPTNASYPSDDRLRFR